MVKVLTLAGTVIGAIFGFFVTPHDAPVSEGIIAGTAFFGAVMGFWLSIHHKTWMY